MSFGFGGRPFGSGYFGIEETTHAAIYDRTIPLQQQEDDANFGGDLKTYLYVVADILMESLVKAWAFVELRDPTLAPSGQELERTLTVTSAVELEPNLWRVRLSSSDDAALFAMWPQSLSDGVYQQDGWIAVVGQSLAPVRAVDAYERTIDIYTRETIGATIGVRPPDLLVRLGDNLGLYADRVDPPKYTRRLLYREPLIRDLKVCERLFTLLGKIYGFQVQLTTAYCIDQSRYLNMIAIDANAAFKVEIDGVMRYFTSAPPLFHFFDQLPADLIPVDRRTDVVLPTTLSSIDEVDGLYCLRLPEADWKNILASTNWQIQDSLGATYYIERISYPEREVIVAAASMVVLNGLLGAMTRIRPGSVVVEVVYDVTGDTITWLDNGQGQLVSPLNGVPAAGTIDYLTGVFSAVTIPGVQVGSDVVVTADGVGVCVLGPAGGTAPAPPAVGAASLIAKPQFACLPNYKRAAVYFFEITPTDVLVDGAADLSLLVQRISDKLDRYIPLHIRLVSKDVTVSAVVTGLLAQALTGELFIELDGLLPGHLLGDRFDQIPADVQPVDTNLHVVSASLTIF